MTTEVADALLRVTSALPGGGEERPGQVEMAEGVAGAIDEGRNLVVQAGTGTGKGLAYLVPAILSRKRVVVATATKALQDQLAKKDLPLIQAHLGQRFTFSVLKGRSNYFCVQRAREIGGGDGQLALDVDDPSDGPLVRDVKRLMEWAASTESGDRAELAFEPRQTAWGQLSVSSVECPGRDKCPSGEDCFAERARDKGARADVLVVNTSLYGAHIASDGNLLPEHDIVIFDEAHELEDIAADAVGLELGAGRLRALARTARPLIAAATACDELIAAADRLDAVLDPLVDNRLRLPLPDELRAVLELAASRVERVVSQVREAKSDRGRSARALQAGGHLVADLRFVQSPPPTHVSWVERQERRAVVKVAAIDVGAILAERLWGNVTAVLTSATIPLGMPERLGLDPINTDELDAGSPFDFEHNALLYCAAHLPKPGDASWEPAMHDELARLLDASGGRTLALFTSWRATKAAAEELKRRVPFRILVQDELPKPALIAAFASDEASCLFATMGFWQGVDVPGRSLSQVVLDRIPFPRPGEPLMDARRERAGRAAAFRTVDLPRAATLLAQGCGRLIRTASDFGVVAVLDSRLATGPYKWDLVHALPPLRRTRDFDDVVSFWKTRA